MQRITRYRRFVIQTTNQRHQHKCKIVKYDIPNEFPFTIPEFPNTGDASEFWDKHVKPGIPAIIRSAPEIENWESYKWKSFTEMNDYLPPNVTILVEKGTYVDHDFKTQDIPFLEYLHQLDDPKQNMKSDIGYLAQCQIFNHFPTLKPTIGHPSVV